jgi:hypothetical protein
MEKQTIAAHKLSQHFASIHAIHVQIPVTHLHRKTTNEYRSQNEATHYTLRHYYEVYIMKYVYNSHKFISNIHNLSLLITLHCSTRSFYGVLLIN